MKEKLTLEDMAKNTMAAYDNGPIQSFLYYEYASKHLRYVQLQTWIHADLELENTNCFSDGNLRDNKNGSMKEKPLMSDIEIGNEGDEVRMG